MKRFSVLFVAVLVGALIISTSVSALILNGNFESGTFGSWTITAFRNNGFSQPPGTTMTNLSAIVGGPTTAPLSLSDPRSNNQIQYPAYGHYSARVNSELSYSSGGYSRNANRITQELSAYIDPADNLSHVKFAYAAVMVNPVSNPHTAEEKPYFRVRVINLSNGGDVLYDFASYVNEPGKNWLPGSAFSGGESWSYLNWQVVDLTPGAGHPVNAGDQIRVEVTAAGCSLGGHPGYVYVDEITDNEIAGPTVTATGPASVVSGSPITYDYTYKNGASNAVNGAVTVTQPAGVSFTSISDTTNCSLSAGTVTCNYNNIPSGASGNFSVTGNVTAGGGGSLAHGNYSISAPGFPTVGGRTVITNVIASVTPSTTTVTSSSNPSVINQNVTFTATIAPVSGNATPTGNVQFVVDGGNFGPPVPVSNGTAQLTTSNLSIGNHTVTANYSGNLDPSSGTLSGGQNVTTAATSTSVSTSNSSSTYGQSVTFTATISTVAPGAGTPDGTVTFFDGGPPIPGCQNVPLNASGQAACTVADLAAGSRTITASYSPGPNFTGGGNTVAQTVNKANLSVTASSHTVTYGAAAPTVTPSYSGFVLGQGVGVLTAPPTCTTSYATGSGASGLPYSTSCNGGASTNYNFVFTNGSVAVQKAQLSVNASSHTVTYGASAPAVTPSYTGFVLGEGIGSISAEPSCTTNYAAGSPVGGSPYSTSCSGGAASNYNFEFTGGTVTVNKAPLSVTASSHTVTYGDPAPNVTPSYTGFVLGESVPVVSTPPSCTTAYTAGSAVTGGPYSTACSGGTSSNYDFVFTAGSVAVNKATLTATASSHTVTYGDTAPSVSPVFSGFVLGEDSAALTVLPSCLTTYSAGSGVAGSPYSTSCSGGASPNYNFAFANGSVGVDKAILAVQASSHAVTYGDAAPVVTPSYSGFVLAEGPATLTTVPTCSTTYTAGASVSGAPYPTSCVGGVSPNYDFAYANGVVTMDRTTLTVTASSPSVTYGDSVPTVTPSYSGFLLGQGPGNLTAQPTCSTTYTQGTGAGTAGLTTNCSGAAAGNYDFVYVPGTVTVGKALVNVTASSHSVSYGAPKPAVTAGYSGFVLSQGPSDLTMPASCSTTYTVGSTVAGGPYSTRCTGASSPNYNFAYTNGAVSMTKASVVVTASSHSVTYGDAAPAVTPSYAGFLFAHGAEQLTTQPICATTYTSGTAAQAANVSTSCTGAESANYDFSYVNGAVSVAKAPLTVTAPRSTLTFGDLPPTLSPSISGFVLGQTASSLATQPTCSSTYTQGSPVSEDDYPVTCSGGTSANYTFNFVSGGLTVGKRELTLTADNKNRVYGASNPSLTSTVTGFAMGQTLATSGVIGQPSLSTPATAVSPVLGGPYPIVASAGTLQSNNYSFRFVNGTLTIDKAVLTISAANTTRPYGMPNPQFGFQYSGFVNGENAQTGGVTGLPSFATAATISSPVGDYPITVSEGTLAAGNYQFVFSGAILSITKAPTTTQITNTGELSGIRSRVGESYNVRWVTTTLQSINGIPTGIVVVADDAGATCSAPVEVGLCSLTSSLPGNRSVTAAYAGDGNFHPSSSGAAAHPTVILIAGNIKRLIPFGNPENLPGSTVTIGGSITGQTTTDASGNYSFASMVPEGNYTVVPSGLGYSYTPTERVYTDVVDNITNADFIAGNGPIVVPSPTPSATPSPTPGTTPTPAVSPSPTPAITPTPTPDPDGTPVPTPTPGPQIGGEGDVVDSSGSPMGGDGVHGDDLGVARGFALGNTEANMGMGQFQRGDTAPRDPQTNLFGDGVIDASDVTVVRLYSLGMLPDTTAAGPVVPDAAPTPIVIAGNERVIRAVSVGTRPGEVVTVQFEIDSQGNESSASFTINYDETVLGNPIVSLGNGVSYGTNLGTNVNVLNEGKIGILIDSVVNYAPGTRQIITVRFNVSPTAQTGLYPVTFENGPTIKSVSSNAGVLLPTIYQTDYVQIGSTASGVAVSGRVTNAAGQGIRNAIVMMTDPDGIRRTATTASFGIYRFESVESGRAYVVSVAGKRYRFSPRVVNVVDSLSDVNFVGQQ